ncbi:Fc receptor-like protein 5, partial [Thunnus thynnus]|uniref:Fc receptor-like protein 5 n=1 Tax=Thunnus thynnus TaxID=8237 RepID=UPI0035283621
LTANRPKAKLSADNTDIPVGGSVTLTCSVDPPSSGWKYHLYKDETSEPLNTQDVVFQSTGQISVSQGGLYWCRGEGGDPVDYTENSDSITINTIENKPKPTLTADKTTIPVRGRVTLTCSVEGSADWKYDWFRQTSDSSIAQPIRNVNPDRVIIVDQGGIYYCRGGRGYPVFSTEDSNKVTIQQTVSNKAVVTLQPNWPVIYSGETITVRCEIRGGADTRWKYEWRENSVDVPRKDKEFRISSASISHTVDFMCMGRGDFFLTEWSEAITLTSLNKPKLTLTADKTIIPVRGSVTLTCSVDDSADWKYYWFRQNSGSSAAQPIRYAEPNRVLRANQGGIYYCRAGRRGRGGDPEIFTGYSNTVTIQKTVSNKAFVTLQPNWPVIYSGETITVRCEIQGGADTRWEYEWRENNVAVSHKDNEFRISSAYVYGVYTIVYSCKGRRDFYSSTEWSEAITLTLSPNKPKPTLTADKTIIPVHGSVTLTCSVDASADWRYEWFGQTSGSSAYQPISNVKPVHKVSQGGIYYCRAGRRGRGGDPEYSNAVTIWKTVLNKATVILQPNWPLIFWGETVTVRCEIQGGGDTKWTYEWTPANLNTSPTLSEHRINSNNYYSTKYKCRGWKDSYSSTEWSDVIALTVLSYKPKAKLSAENRNIPVGGSVTLTCSVDPSSSGWKYYLYKTSEPLNTQDAVFQSTGQISVSQGGLYWCRGGRGNPVYYTEDSDVIRINKYVSNKVVVTLQPNWTEIYRGEAMMLRCEIHDGDTEWEYEWETPRYTSPNQNEYMISKASSYDSGNYRCKGRMKNAQRTSTEWSDYIKLTVSDNAPESVLTVSPSWLSPGDSVTLSCKVEHPSAGWRFYWYKTIPKLSDNSYSYELLPGSTNGTEQDSYIIHGSTHTARYMCRAGRGDPVFYTQYSKPEFVWSGDVHSAVTLKVSPDRVQHFTSDSVSLSCEGNSTEWRVRRFPEDHYWSYCSNWRSMTGSTCNINSYQQSDAVYWCESGSGEFSNAVNITIQNADIILVSPVHPVTEGDSVTLGCKLKRGELLSNVVFYQNDKLIQNDTRGELNISAVSKSDEGFYKCKYSGKESQQGWMSVKAVSRPESSSSLIPLIVGLVCGIILIILLLLLYRYRRSKDSHFIRPIQSESTNQNENSSSLHDAGESQDITYSSIELKNVAKTGKRHETVESSVYADVKIGSAADDNLTYTQVNYHNKGKAKKHKGKSTPAATDEAVYSEVKPGTSLGQ